MPVRLIDANAAADKIMHEVEVHADEIGIGAVAIMIAFARALRDETDFPTIKPEVRHGRWVKIEQNGSQFRRKCSECGGIVHAVSDFCPDCGAKMNGKDINVAAKMGGADNGE